MPSESLPISGTACALFITEGAPGVTWPRTDGADRAVVLPARD